MNLLNQACHLLENENTAVRPRDDLGLPGGLINLSPQRTTVLLPDIHGRMDMVRDVQDLPLISPEGQTSTLYAGLQENWAQLVCVGDYVHGEARVFDRWITAEQEYLEGYENHRAMDQEMAENLETVEMLLSMKLDFPDQVHLLKGNHENITNQLGEGNFPFRKFVQEGPMVLAWMQKFYPPIILELFSRLEKNYPLLARSQDFLVTHAEPSRFFSPEEVLNYRTNPEVVAGLTWTDNNKSEPGSVEHMIQNYLGVRPGSPEWESVFHFGGHRVIPGIFQTRAQGRYVQFHNAKLRIAAILVPGQTIDLTRDIITF
ncbi:MAG: hypothetical protein A2Z96_06575 [Spirochaetes bacterium GWB1_48_6]|nr:MAG: hypothetical protein A2Z96_06575 [Spirochaetes bacterium GWB1_48_6]